jgi:chemotaxis signal transduction protein
MFAGSRCIGLFADQIESITDWRTPAPLPDAPAGVLGIVSIRARISTVLDAAVLIGKSADTVESVRTRNSKLETPDRPRGVIVKLRGDEQIALAVDRIGEVIELAPDDLQVDGKDSQTSPLLLGTVARDKQSIAVLNHQQLFATAMRGRERRQRHF